MYFQRPLAAADRTLLVYNEGIQTTNVQQVIMDGPLCDEGPKRKALWAMLFLHSARPLPLVR